MPKETRNFMFKTFPDPDRQGMIVGVAYREATGFYLTYGDCEEYELHGGFEYSEAFALDAAIFTQTALIADEMIGMSVFVPEVHKCIDDLVKFFQLESIKNEHN